LKGQSHHITIVLQKIRMGVSELAGKGAAKLKLGVKSQVFMFWWWVRSEQYSLARICIDAIQISLTQHI
jgi:hypothetical protein